MTLDADGALPEFSGSYSVDLNWHSLTVPNQTTYDEFIESNTTILTENDGRVVIDHNNFKDAAGTWLADYYRNYPEEYIQDVYDLESFEWGAEHPLWAWRTTPWVPSAFPWFFIKHEFDGNTKVIVSYDGVIKEEYTPSAEVDTHVLTNPDVEWDKTYTDGDPVQRTYSFFGIPGLNLGDFTENASWNDNVSSLDTSKFEVKLISGYVEESGYDAWSVTVKFENADENVPLTFVKGDDGKISIQEPTDTPTKEWSTFKWWTNNGEDYTFGEAIDGDVTLAAKWEEEKSSSSNKSSWWGGGWSRASSTNTDNEKATEDSAKLDEPTAEDNNEEQANEENKDEEKAAPMTEAQAVEKFGQEQIDAYKWALENGITTMKTVEDARLDQPLTRAELAKMMVVYIQKVLEKDPVVTGDVSYPDVDESLGDLYGYIKLAYQYQIMGINADGTPIELFNPYGLVTRWEYATVFSRVLFGDKFNKAGEDFYAKHLEALKAAWILTNTIPTIQEMRGWVMLMMYRSSQNSESIESVANAPEESKEEPAAEATTWDTVEEPAVEATTWDTVEEPTAEATTWDTVEEPTAETTTWDTVEEPATEATTWNTVEEPTTWE